MFIQAVSELQQPGQGTAQNQAASSELPLKPDFRCKLPSMKYGARRAIQLTFAHVAPDSVKFLFPEAISDSLPHTLLFKMNVAVFSVSKSLLILPVESPLEARKLHKSLAMMISYATVLVRT